MRIKVVRLELDDDQHIDLSVFEDLVNEQSEDLQRKGFKVKDILIDRFRNKLTAIIKYRRPIWGIL